MKQLCSLLKKDEKWLVERVLSYALKQGYAQYSSTLDAAWRSSIEGLTNAVIRQYETGGNILPEFHPDDSYDDDPVTCFGVTEARRHRKRGISLSMFLGLYKYYRYSYEDYVQQLTVPCFQKHIYRSFIERVFDRIEIAFCSQWSTLKKDKAIAELQESNRLMTNEKNKYLTLFESLNLPTFLIGENGYLENLNVPASTLLGEKNIAGHLYYSLEKHAGLLQNPLYKWIPWLEESIGRLLTGTESSFQVYLEEPKEIGGRSFHVLLSRMSDISKKFKGGIVVVEDITEQKLLERLKEDVDKIMRHDLKIPLSGIIGIINFLLDSEQLDQQHEKMLTIACESAYDMLSMINISLDTYKMEVGTYQFEPTSVDLKDLLKRLSYNLENYATGPGAPFSITINGTSFEHTSSGPYVMADEMLLFTALGNLLKNALEASPLGEKVLITIESKEICRIIISNKGGVPEKIRGIFFEKYTTWGKTHGTGLGNYSSRLIITTMGGTISMFSENDSTEVTVTLPLDQKII